MKFNAFKVCDELMFRIEAAPAPGGYMKAYTGCIKKKVIELQRAIIRELLCV
jgi:hypothetical protein